MGSIQVVRAADIQAAPPGVSSDAWARRVTQFDARIGINAPRNPPGAISRWHHHGANTGYVYVLEGRVRAEWGPEGRNATELGAGDFYVIDPDTIHREANPGSEEQVLVAFIVGSGPRFVNVDGPEPNGGTARPRGSIRAVRGAHIPAGPPSIGMTRNVTDLDDALSLGVARTAPQTTTGWHHHGTRTACAYVVRGRTRLEWGAGGRESAELAAGDLYLVPPSTIYRDGNPGSEELVVVGFLLGQGPKVVNVEGPEPG